MQSRKTLAATAILVLTFSILYAQEPIRFDFEKNRYSALITETYLACEDPAEITRAFAAFGGSIGRGASASLRLRGCKILDVGDHAWVLGIAPEARLPSSPRFVPGYWVHSGGDFERMWYPQIFVGHFSIRPKVTSKPAVSPDPTHLSDLTGALPVGRWVMWADFDPAEYAKTNRGMPRNGWYWESEREPGLNEFSFLEIAHKGVAHTMLYNGDDKVIGGFTFPAGGEAIWSVQSKFGWQWQYPKGGVGGYLILQGQHNNPYIVVDVHADYVVLLQGELRSDGHIRALTGAPVLMVRIGSQLDHNLLNFFGCVMDNEDVPLQDVTACADPFVDANGRKMPNAGVGELRATVQSPTWYDS